MTSMPSPSRPRTSSTFRLAALVVVVLAAVAASAVAEFVPSGSFSGPGAGDGELNTPRRAAVEQSTGNLFVVDSGNDRVQVFSRDGDSGAYLTQFGAGTLDDPFGIAIDESGGQTVVYVSSASNGGEIVKFESDEAATPTLTVDATYTSPVQGADADQVQSFASPLVLAPNGDLWVADRGAEVLKRFDASGAHVAGSNFDGSTSGTAFTGLLDVAVDPSTGDLLVVDENGDTANSTGTGRVERFAADGSHELTIGPVGPNQRPATVTVNPSSGDVIVSGEQDAVYRDSYPTIHQYASDGALRDEFPLSGSAVYTSIHGLAIDTANARLYVVLDSGYYFGAPYGTPHIEVLRELFPPELTIDPVDAGGVSATGATFSGTVDANGKQTDWHFEYRVAGSGDWMSTPVQDAGAGTEPVPTGDVTVSGLQPNRDYEVRLVADNDDGNSTAGPETFHTAIAPPTISPIPGSGRTDTEVRINSTINANGLPTTYYFEWGADTDYGNRIPAAGSQSAGSGSHTVRYSKPLSGLQPGTTIHYRVVATNAAGTTTGPDQAVDTLAEPIDFEMVSPPDKNGGAVSLWSAQVAPDGETASWTSTAAFSGTAANFQVNVYRSERSADGWSTESLMLPQSNPNGFFKNAGTKGLSDDLSRVMQFSTHALAPGAVEGKANYYVRDIPTGELSFLGIDTGFGPWSLSPQPFVDATPDGSHIVFETTAAFTSDAVEGAQNAYIYADGELELLNYLPDGSYTPSVEIGDVTVNRQIEHVLSEDGSRVFFMAPGGSFGQAAVFMREDGQTVPISISEVADDDEAYGARWRGASADGSVVYFTSGYDLTADAPPEVANKLYRYDVDEHDVTYVPLVGDADYMSGVYNISRDGSYIYFSGGKGVFGTDRIFVHHDGETKLIADLEEPRTGDGAASSMLSDNGRHFAFLAGTKDLAGAPTTSTGHGCDEYPLGGTPQWIPGYCFMAYVYDAETEDLTCASCDPSGTRPTAHTEFNSRGFEATGGYMRRAVLDDGSFFFDSYDRMVPEDVNSKRDAYRWRDGQIDLISTGKSDANSAFGDVTPDGRHVFFMTSEQLVGQDRDHGQDIYVARAGGGIAAQNPPAAKPPCEGSACQGDIPSPPDRVAAGSERLLDSGNFDAGPRAHAAFGRLSAVRLALARRGRATITVRVNRAGRVSLRARAKLGSRTVTVGRASKSAARAGAVRLTLRLSKPARTQLASRGRLRMSLVLSFAGQAGLQRSTLRLSR